MVNLNSIDLTRGKRFERIMESEEFDKQNRRDERGIRRLKKGEIPRVSTSFNYTNIHTSSNNWVITTTTVDNILNDWVSMGSFENTWATSTQPSYTISFDRTFNSTQFIEINDHTSTSSININDWNMYNIDTNDITIENRLRKDPFKSFDDGREYVYKLREQRGLKHLEISSNLYNNIYNRLHGEDNFKLVIFPDDHDTLLKRLHLLDIDFDTEELSFFSPNEIFNYHNHKSNKRDLKELAPFIKRVYVTNGGRSFDSTELNFDMVLAKEHFDRSVEMSNLLV